MGIIYGPLIITAFLTLADIYLNNYDDYIKGGLFTLKRASDLRVTEIEKDRAE